MTFGPLMPAEAGIQFLAKALGPRWSMCAGLPKAGPAYGDERNAEDSR
jgi:hypothetical protein